MPSFHTFPLDKETHNKWIHSIRRKDFNITLDTRVCSRRFKSDDVIEPLTLTGRPPWAHLVPVERLLCFSTKAQWQMREVSTPVDEDPVLMDSQHLKHDYCSVSEPAAVDLHKEGEQLRKQMEKLEFPFGPIYCI